MSDVHAARRTRVLDALGSEGALILAAAPELTVGADTDVRYLPDPDLYYLTGYDEPEAVAVLSPSADQVFTLFVRPRDPERERWTGVRGGVEAAVALANAAHPIAELGAKLPALIAGATRVYIPFASLRTDVENAVRSAVQQSARNRPRTGRGAQSVVDARSLLAPLRVIKDADELNEMRAAADISVAAFRTLARALPRLAHEYEGEALLEHTFRTLGAMGPAFPSIVAGGRNATVLHYTTNNARLGQDDLVLVDAGARYRMYCADITRTFPVRGRFGTVQREAYDVVYQAHQAALACVEPGRSIADMENAALRALTEGMVSLGLLTGDVADLLEQRAYRRYFPHRISHWLGLDVHDAGDYMRDGEPVRLAPGMALTIEPGLYVPADDADAPEALRGVGIRLEDDVVVTTGGADVLTGALELAPDEVEELVGSAAD